MALKLHESGNFVMGKFSKYACAKTYRNRERFDNFDNLSAMMSGGMREDYQNRSVLYCVLKLCTVISTDEQFLQFPGLGFVTLGPFHCA